MTKKTIESLILAACTLMWFWVIYGLFDEAAAQDVHYVHTWSRSCVVDYNGDTVCYCTCIIGGEVVRCN